MIEVDQQAASSLSRCSTCDVVRELRVAGACVVTSGLHTYGQRYGGLIGILPRDIDQTVVGTETGGLQRHLLRSEGQSEVGLDEELDGVRLIGSSAALAFVLLSIWLKACHVRIGILDPQVATVGHLAGHKVLVGIAKLSLLAVFSCTEGEGCCHRLVVEFSQFLALAVVGDSHAVNIITTAEGQCQLGSRT